MVANMSDEDIWRLNRGGHDPHKVYAAYPAAVKHTGQPTVILAKTVKGYGMGGRRRPEHHTFAEKNGHRRAQAFRDRFDMPISDDELERPLTTAARGQPGNALHARAPQGAGRLPAGAHHLAEPLTVPGLDIFSGMLEGSGDREISTTMGFVRMLTVLMRDKNSASTSCPSFPTKRAPSAWKACSARSASIPPSASSTSRWIRTRSCITRRTEGPDPRRRHQRGRFHVLLDRGGHVLQPTAST